MKIRRCFSIVVASLLVCWGCDSGKGGSSARPKVGEQFAFALPDSPEFLTDETALSVAQGGARHGQVVENELVSSAR